MRAGPWVVATTVVIALGCNDGVDSPPGSLEIAGTWATVPVYEIGSPHGERASFQRISDIRLGDDGERVYVADPREAQVTVWTPEGSLLLSVGGEGEGPGEFRGSTGAIHLTRDGFQVQDRDHFVQFALDGRHLATVPVPSSVSYRGFRFRPLAMLEDGSLLVYPSVDSAYRIGWWGGDPVDELPVVRLMERDGHWTADTLAILDVRTEVLGTGDPDNLALTMFTAQPYRDPDQVFYNAQFQSVVLVRMKGLDPGEVDLTELSAEGDTVWSRRMSFVPLPLSAKEVDELVGGLAEGLADIRGSPSLLGDARKAVREALYVPEHYPPVQDAALASNGELWMRTFEDAGTDSLNVWYAVRVRETDSPVRRILLPTSFSPHDATDTHVWGSRRDAFDVRYVVGRQLIRQAIPTEQQVWSTQADIVVGGEPGSAAALSRLSSVEADASGTRIVVRQSQRITVWDTASPQEPVFEFGPRDDTPPFGAPRRGVPDSTGFWIRYDGGWGRFAHDGRLLSSTPNPPDRWLQSITILGDGSFLARERNPPLSRVFEWEERDPGWYIAVAHLRLAEGGWIVDTLGTYDSSGREFAVAIDGDRTFSNQPFFDRDMLYFDSRNRVVGFIQRRGSDGEVRVVEIAPGNDTILDARVPVRPVPLERERAEAAIEEKMREVQGMLRQFGRDSLSTPQVRAIVEEELHIPDRLPLVTGVVPTASNEVWLRSSEPADSLAIWYAIDRANPSSPLRRVLLPEWFRLRDATRDHVWGLHRDARFAGQVQGRRLVPLPANGQADDLRVPSRPE